MDKMVKVRMKKETVKLLKKVSRKKIATSLLRGKIIPSRKRKLIEKALKKASLDDSGYQ
ncbi:MAG: hypothetical protein AB1390_01335 [Nitrospirota bacterium]